MDMSVIDMAVAQQQTGTNSKSRVTRLDHRLVKIKTVKIPS